MNTAHDDDDAEDLNCDMYNKTVSRDVDLH